MPEVPRGDNCSKFLRSKLGTVITDYNFWDAMAGEVAGQLPDDCSRSRRGQFVNFKELTVVVDSD